MKTLDFSQIVQRSWGYVRQYRALWWLGLLAAFTDKGSFGVPNLSNPLSNAPGNSTTSPDSKDSFINYLKNSGSEQNMQRITDWVSLHKASIIEGGLIVLLIVLYVIYVSVAARAGLMKKIQELEDGAADSQITFQSAFQQGKLHVWRLIGFNLLLTLLIIAVFVVSIGLATAGYASYAAHSNYSTALLILAVVAALFLLAVLLFTVVFQKLTERAIVLKDQKITQAMRSTARLIAGQRANTVWSWLVSIALSIMGGIALGFLVILALLVLGLLGLGFYALAHTVGNLLIGGATIAALALFIYIYILTGIYHAFVSAYWTIVYRAMDYISTN
jgi:hypothetical protein